MENSLARLLVVEDFGPFLQSISSKLARRRDLRIVCTVSDGEEAVRKATELKPDLILLDIGLPTFSGIEAARQIRKLVPESKIIFLSQYSEPDICAGSTQLGGLRLRFETKRCDRPASNVAFECRQRMQIDCSCDLGRGVSQERLHRTERSSYCIAKEAVQKVEDLLTGPKRTQIEEIRNLASTLIQ